MAGVKGMRTGGFGGRKKLPPNQKRNINMNFRCTQEEKELIEKLKGNLSLTEFILKKIKED